MNLKIIALAISILGISLLLALSLYIEPQLSTIKNIQNKQLYEQVRVQGTVINQKTVSQEFIILTIEDQTGKVDVLLDKHVQIPINSTIQITGKITEYIYKNQVQADKIRIIS